MGTNINMCENLCAWVWAMQAQVHSYVHHVEMCACMLVVCSAYACAVRVCWCDCACWWPCACVCVCKHMCVAMHRWNWCVRLTIRPILYRYQRSAESICTDQPHTAFRPCLACGKGIGVLQTFFSEPPLTILPVSDQVSQITSLRPAHTTRHSASEKGLYSPPAQWLTHVFFSQFLCHFPWRLYHRATSRS